jgi:hypothetical protein
LAVTWNMNYCRSVGKRTLRCCPGLRYQADS